MCFKLLCGDTVHVFNWIDFAYSYMQRLYLSKYRCEDAFEIRSLRPHSEVNWVVYDHILLAVCMHGCPGSHWRTTYLMSSAEQQEEATTTERMDPLSDSTYGKIPRLPYDCMILRVAMTISKWILPSCKFGIKLNTLRVFFPFSLSQHLQLLQHSFHWWFTLNVWKN